MTREELIEQEAESLIAKIKGATTSFHKETIKISFVYGINSQLAKDLQELAVIEGKIEVLMWVNLRLSFSDILKSDIYRDIEQLSSTRTELLKRLNLEG
jgi:hypothetical protein